MQPHPVANYFGQNQGRSQPGEAKPTLKKKFVPPLRSQVITFKL